MPNGTATVEDWRVLTKLNMFLPDDPAITLLEIYSNVLETYIHTKTHIQIFIVTSLIMPKLGTNQSVPQ